MGTVWRELLNKLHPAMQFYSTRPVNYGTYWRAGAIFCNARRMLYNNEGEIAPTQNFPFGTLYQELRGKADFGD